MTTSQDDAFAHVVTIMGIDSESVKALTDSKINQFRKLSSTKMDTFKRLAENSANQFAEADADQIHIFQKWYTSWRSKARDSSLDEMIACFTEEEWDSYVHKSNLLSGLSGITGSLGGSSRTGTASQPIVIQDPEITGIKVSLKDYPTTTGKSTDWPRYKRKFISTATAAGHAELLTKVYVVPSEQVDPQAHSRYLKLNRKTFSAIDYGTSDSTLWNVVEKFRATQDGRQAFLALDLHQRGQGCEETCATNAFDELLGLRLTPNFPGGAEAFVNKWDETIRKLEDLDQGAHKIRPSEWLEKTLFKESIKDSDFDSVLTTLNAISPPVSLDKCKTEIRKRGAHLARDRKKTAVAKARMTRMYDDHNYWEYDGQPTGIQDEAPYDIEDMRFMAALSADTTNRDGKDNLWYVPSHLWSKHSEEQRKIWDDL